jgi:hypothetical protein
LNAKKQSYHNTAIELNKNRLFHKRKQSSPRRTTLASVVLLKCAIIDRPVVKRLFNAIIDWQHAQIQEKRDAIQNQHVEEL